MTDYTAWPVIGRGAERTCYLNPVDKTRLVKISPRKNAKQTLREIKYFRFLIRRGIPFDHIPKFYGEISGDDFIGFEQEFISGDDPRHDSIPETLEQYLRHLSSQEDIQKLRNALEKLKTYLLRYNIIPCDLLPDNIVVKHGTTGPKLILIDGLGGTELIPASNYFKLLGNRKILRKWEKFSKKLSAKFQQLDL
ncbi:YrbL family protein [Oxalobacter aliiformigenes]|uniref:YrbL family protein n=1 Tax=Oxalobacter aliiformigenes TaxID=2946593 RepID=UPI0022AEF2E2|nr:YrbL family protein [Oxalobacter aliiformigenes]WAV89992.1 YrbL family protein [Oxalobacter aliiformigenes]